jgi:hypothetical protein
MITLARHMEAREAEASGSGEGVAVDDAEEGNGIDIINVSYGDEEDI